MALHRGIQSALFYYLSCAPCTEARHRRKRRKEADLARIEKQISDRTGSSNNGGYHYQHPLPSNTNTAWDIEIALGPSRESKAAAKQQKSNKNQLSDYPSRSSNSTSKSPKNSKQPSDSDLRLESRIAWASTFQRTYAESPALLPTKPQKAHTPPTRSTTLSSTSTARPPTGSSSSRPARPHAPPHNTPNPTFTPNHPPLNDQHPPTVTKYNSPNEIAWMLEPPPPARVMRGYENERPHRTPSTIHVKSPIKSDDHDQRDNDLLPIASATKSDGSVVSDTPDVGLGLQYNSADDSYDDDDEHEMADADLEHDRRSWRETQTGGGATMEKRDSAGPIPERIGKGSSYLFPPDEWSQREAVFADKSAARRDPRWRWSSDW